MESRQQKRRPSIDRRGSRIRGGGVGDGEYMGAVVWMNRETSPTAKVEKKGLSNKRGSGVSVYAVRYVQT